MRGVQQNERSMYDGWIDRRMGGWSCTADTLHKKPHDPWQRDAVHTMCVCV